MAIDIINSRRDYPYIAEWHKRKANRRVNQEIIKRDDSPYGVFYCREVQGIERASEINVDAFDNPYESTTIETQDDVSEMVKGDLVKYISKKWIVTSVTRKRINKRCYFTDNASSVYLIELRAGL